MRYEVFVRRPPKTPPGFRPPRQPYVRRLDEEGTHNLWAYEGSPIPVVVGASGDTVAFQISEETWCVYHARTGAELHRFRSR